jgi:hypothetical protein
MAATATASVPAPVAEPESKPFEPAMVADERPGARTLEDAILSVWEELSAKGQAGCPACGGTLERGGGCSGCGAELS